MDITTLKGILNRKFGGANIDEVQGISDYSLFQEAASFMMAEINPAETVRLGTLEVFADVYDYDPQDDLKELVDLRPQTTRGVDDNLTRRYTEQFDQEKANNDFAIEWRDGVKVLRYSRKVSGNI